MSLIDTKFWKKFIPKMKYFTDCVNDGDEDKASTNATPQATAAIAARMVFDVDASGHLLQMLFSR
jgi:hypothetical protein